MLQKCRSAPVAKQAPPCTPTLPFDPCSGCRQQHVGAPGFGAPRRHLPAVRTRRRQWLQLLPLLKLRVLCCCWPLFCHSCAAL